MTAVAFPLRDDYFEPLAFTPKEEREMKQLVADQTQQTLDEEQPLLASNYENVDSSEWKLFKTKDQMRVYRPRHAPMEGTEPPSILAVGTIEGTLEDVIYGIHNTTTRDIRVTRAFLSDTALDSAVLHVFENGTDDDPFHSLAIKWRAVATPAGTLVKNRDGCVLEYMGIKRDASGKRYAVQVSENFEHPACPSFDPKDVIRADVHVRAIYREVGPQRVGVYFRVGYNSRGRIPKILASWTAASLAVAVSKSVECAEAKKLTALALDNHTVLHRQYQHLPRPQNTIQQCSICNATPRTFSGGAMGECQICGIRVCPKCSTRKFLLSDEAKIRVSCCKQCIIAAKNVHVDPRKPLRLLSSASWYNHNLVVESIDPHARRLSKASVANSLSSSRSSSSTQSTKISFELSPELSAISPPAIALLGSHHSRYSLDCIDTVDQSGTTQLRRMPSAPHDRLLMQMEQLRIAAELTYQMTTHQASVMHREARPAGRMARGHR